MKLLKITTAYPVYLKQFYEKQRKALSMSYTELKALFDYDAAGWADFWSEALKPLGYDVMEIAINNAPLQRLWASEKGLQNPNSVNLNEIAIEQARCFSPDVVWFDNFDEDLLARILKETPSVSVVLGWVGSAIPQSNIWHNMDLILSCAPESVDLLKNKGLKAHQLHHAFDPRINSRLLDRKKKIDLSFIGQILRESQFHSTREKILKSLCKRLPVQIFSPVPVSTIRGDLKVLMNRWAYRATLKLKSIGFSQNRVVRLPFLGKMALGSEEPGCPLNRLEPLFFKPPVFGLEMFQVLRDSKMTLNIHADSSPTHASNMRLFEATGVGTCLITDWKENVQELFEPDKEVVTFKSAEECIEKVRWLLDHPEEREQIAKAGQARCLRDHSFVRRAPLLDRIIKSVMT